MQSDDLSLSTVKTNASILLGKQVAFAVNTFTSFKKQIKQQIQIIQNKKLNSSPSLSSKDNHIINWTLEYGLSYLENLFIKSNNNNFL